MQETFGPITGRWLNLYILSNVLSCVCLCHAEHSLVAAAPRSSPARSNGVEEVMLHDFRCEDCPIQTVVAKFNAATRGAHPHVRVEPEPTRVYHGNYPPRFTKVMTELLSDMGVTSAGWDRQRESSATRRVLVSLDISVETAPRVLGQIVHEARPRVQVLREGDGSVVLRRGPRALMCDVFRLTDAAMARISPKQGDSPGAHFSFGPGLDARRRIRLLRQEQALMVIAEPMLMSVLVECIYRLNRRPDEEGVGLTGGGWGRPSNGGDGAGGDGAEP